jgi:hypothetical protein
MELAAAPCSPASNTAEPVESPIPPRFWWLKRLTVLALVFFALLAGVRWWWAREADRRLAALIADARSRGEPVFPEEFAPKSVPDDQNAAILFDQAAAAIAITPQFSRLDPPGVDPSDPFKPLTSSQLQIAGTNLAANRRALDLARQAASRPAASWGSRDSSQAIRKRGMPQRNLAKLLCWAAVYSHANGDDREALSLVGDLLAQSRAMDSGPMTFMTRRYSMLMEGEAVSAVRRISNDLWIDPGSSKAATRQQALDITTLLLDDAHYHSVDVRSWFALRADRLEVLRQIRQYLTNPVDLALEPMYRIDLLRTFAYLGDEARAAEQIHCPPASTYAPPDDGGYINSPLYLMTRPSEAIIARRTGIEQFYRATIVRRVAAVKLAIRLYQLDHTGAHPATLDQLVPEYLPAVPRDAMAADDRPLGYSPETHPPFLYSVWATKPEPFDMVSIRINSDDVFLLEPPPQGVRQLRLSTNREINASPATKAVHNQNSTTHDTGR